MTDEGKEREALLDKIAAANIAPREEALALLRSHDARTEARIVEEAAKVCDGISEAWSRKRVMTQESVRERDGGTCAAAECGDAIRALAPKGEKP